MKIKSAVSTALAVFVLFSISCNKETEEIVVPSNSHGGQLMKSGTTARSISGSMHYVLTTTQNLPCACDASLGYFSSGIYSGNGVLTHLGLSASLINPCMKFIYTNGNPTGIDVGSECNTLVAANGDQLTCSIRPYSLNFVNQYGDASGPSVIDITGGTGRFAGASGLISGLVTIHLATSTADFTGITGTITY